MQTHRIRRDWQSRLGMCGIGEGFWRKFVHAYGSAAPLDPALYAAEEIQVFINCMDPHGNSYFNNPATHHLASGQLIKTPPEIFRKKQRRGVGLLS